MRLAEAGRNTEASAAYREALNRARTDTERRYLARRLQEVSPTEAPPSSDKR